ncbi:MAG: hypothetical protein HYX69_18500 [Planctomycetia bacterium]|nr:hypothetical protein [Planctomycetia bacterium]
MVGGLAKQAKEGSTMVRNRVPLKVVLAIAAIVAVVGSAAMADAGVTADFYNFVGGASGTTVTYTPNFPSSTGSSTLSVSNGGVFFWTDLQPSTPDLVNAPGDSNPANFVSFCIEVGQHISYGDNVPYDFGLIALGSAPKPGIPGVSPMGALAANLIEQLWYNHFNDLFTPSGVDQVKAGAFQLAIWELTYDVGTGANGVNLTDGIIKASMGTVRSLASSWLGELDWTNNGQDQPRASLLAMSSSTYQDQVVASTIGNLDQTGGGTVPEASSVVVWSLLGLVCVGFKRWRSSVTAG